MKLETAIEITTNYLSGDEPDNPSDLPDAFRLLIEAGKRVQELRLRYNSGIPYWLPGETEFASLMRATTLSRSGLTLATLSELSI